MIVGLNGGCFHNYGFKLFSGKPISQFVAASFLSIVVVLISLAALFALFPAQSQNRLCLPQSHPRYCSRSPSCHIIFQQNIAFKFIFMNCKVYDFILIFFFNLGCNYIAI